MKVFFSVKSTRLWIMKSNSFRDFFYIINMSTNVSLESKTTPRSFIMSVVLGRVSLLILPSNKLIKRDREKVITTFFHINQK